VFIAGLAVFSAASLAGGLATSQAWLLTARAVQGAGGAMIAPTALALIATTFAEGRARNRAMGVYAAMSGGGAAAGLVAGGLLTTYLSWRWVLFVNVPIGVLTAGVAPLVLAESARRRGRLDLPGAVTGTGAVALLVYGLSNASADQAGVSHWADLAVVAALAAAAILLASGIAPAAAVTAVVAIRVRREDLASPPAAAQWQPTSAHPAMAGRLHVAGLAADSADIAAPHPQKGAPR
jgi:MFS family permease